MLFYSTNGTAPSVSLREAVLQGLAPDGGLYMPEYIPQLPDDFLSHLTGASFQDIALEVARPFLKDEAPEAVIQDIVTAAINFDAPLVTLEQNIYALELFHGPTLAFKDFGARFMARLMSYFVQNDSQSLTILVATSGDTGSAVAQGFFGVPGIEVVLLYPSGKVSATQEAQLTTVGGNVSALEVDGSFDDCQRMVKEAFLDRELGSARRLTSANSINIARLIPQSFYYVHAFNQLPENATDCIVSVPSGNFGNLTAGLIAKRMGLPIQRFIAATNVNDVVPEFLHGKAFQPRPSTPTLSNAMDVGNPSNFARMLELYGDDLSRMQSEIFGCAFGDEETMRAVQRVYDSSRYLMDPHGAVGYLGLKKFIAETGPSVPGIFLETAHPGKFRESIEGKTSLSCPLPETLQQALNIPQHSIKIAASYAELKGFLQS